eukprot:TRINITY_DN43077_c0_g1_i1.p1 TRINITY_DN43077_c0_g1~~TRINITY_DN43077_c0_g1_i1.p1  ORF type:complete len:259 (+),score=51.85 TRINITY_DN43077_c0_g1_i1:46-777(+)
MAASKVDAEAAQEEPEDPIFVSVFPPSKKLDAYSMAFDDMAVFENAGHSREHIGQLATYGFVNFSGMRRMLEGIAARLRPETWISSGKSLAKALSDTSFLDLGSGDGRAVIAAAVLAPTLRESIGVELSVSRHELAVRNRRGLPEDLKGIVRFEQCDIFKVDASCLGSTEIVYLANLRFPDETVEAINDHLEKHCAIENDAVVATLRECNFTRPCTSWTENVSMSWNPEGWPVFCYHLPALKK